MSANKLLSLLNEHKLIKGRFNIMDTLYNSSALSGNDIQYRTYFGQLQSEFGGDYEIWIRKEDFDRFLAAGIVNRNSKVAVTIYLMCGNRPVPNPLNSSIINLAKNHFLSGNDKDLTLNLE